jgi:hypothetical protein
MASMITHDFPLQVRHFHHLVSLYIHAMNRVTRSWNSGLQGLFRIWPGTPDAPKGLAAE